MTEAGHTREDQMSKDFVVEMMYRTMISGYDKYGSIKSYIEANADYSNLESLKARLKLYEETKDKKYLVDVANYAMFEYMHPLHKI